jgi:serine/threonine-protein kinase HipA
MPSERLLGAGEMVRVVVPVSLRQHLYRHAEAMGLPSGLKYERYGTDNRRFDASSISRVLELTVNPAIAKQNFIAATIFHMVVGNTDNHAKNHALIYEEGGSSPRLAPLYDILPVRLDRSVTHELSFKLGAASTFDEMTKEDLTSFLRLFGLSTGAIKRFASDVIAPMLTVLDEASGNFTRQGLRDFDDLIGREAGRLAGLLELKVDLRERDYFPSTGR